MRLLRFGGPSIEKPGLVDPDGRIRDLSVYLTDVDETIISPRGLAALRQLDWRLLPVIESGVRLGPILERTNRLIAVAVSERGAVAASRFAATLKGARPTGPDDAIEIPRRRTRIGMRVALGVVIGTSLRHATRSEARDGIAGYCVANDVTDTDPSGMDGRTALAGSAETFAPLGPYLVTSDEVAEPGELQWWLELNGARHSSGKVIDGDFDVAEMIGDLSDAIKLWPGDVVVCAGVRDPVGGTRAPALLRPGDATMSGIAQLGEQRQRCVAEGDRGLRRSSIGACETARETGTVRYFTAPAVNPRTI
jgi:hypothetical protein